MFQFKNTKTNKIYTLNEIDAIAAKFWGKEIHSKHYAYPGEPLDKFIHNPNWFDILGRAIEDCQYIKTKFGETHNEFDMDKVASMILFDNTLYEKDADRKLEMAQFMRPYIELCYHLQSLNIEGVGCGW